MSASSSPHYNRECVFGINRVEPLVPPYLNQISISDVSTSNLAECS